MSNAIRLRLIGGAVLLFIFWFIGHYNIQGPAVLLVTFGFVAVYELLVVRPQIKNDDEQKKKHQISSGGDNTQQDIKCKNCGFVAFGISDRKAEITTCNNCGMIIGANPSPEEKAQQQQNQPFPGILPRRKQALHLCGTYLRYTIENYTNISLTIIAAALCVIAFKLFNPTPLGPTYGATKIPVVFVHGGNIDADVSGEVSVSGGSIDAEVSGTVSIDR